MNNILNDHNVYILGAGFSAPGKMPLISNFLNYMRDAYQYYVTNEDERQAKFIEEVFNFRQSASSAAYRINLDLENIEHLFSLASASDAKSTKNIKHAICSTIKYCQLLPKPTFNIDIPPGHFNNSILKHYSQKLNQKLNSKYTIEVPFYSYASLILSGYLLENSKNSIITFNYDRLIEESLEKLSVPYNYIINNNMKKNDGIPILKLHGSTNWGMKENGNINIYSNYPELLESNSEPVIIPPTWNKTFEGKLRIIWDRAIKYLSTATRIIFIGFSMPKTDLHFKYLLAAGLKNNISLREIYIIDPNVLKMESKINKLFNNKSITRVSISLEETSTEQYFKNNSFNRIGRSSRETRYQKLYNQK